MKTVIAAVLIAMTGISPAFSAGELPFATDEWAPFVSKNMEGYGFYTEIVSASVSEMGMTPQYSFVPWNKGEMMTRTGKAFASFPYSETPERQKEFYFSDPVLDEKQKIVFFYNRQSVKEAPQWRELEDLKAFRIGCIMSSKFVSPLEKAGLKTVYTNSEESNIKILYAQGVDLILTNETVGRYMIRKLYPKERDLFGILEKAFLTGGDPKLMVSRVYPEARELMNRFTKALKQIKEKGIYKNILIKHEISGP